MVSILIICPIGHLGNQNAKALLHKLQAIEVSFPSLRRLSINPDGIQFSEDIKVKLHTQQPITVFLVLSDEYYPGWQATIDGQPIKICQKNYVHRGVKVPSESHVVTFSFHPLSFAIGSGISAASFAILLYLVATDRRLKAQTPVILPS